MSRVYTCIYVLYIYIRYDIQYTVAMLSAFRWNFTELSIHTRKTLLFRAIKMHVQRTLKISYRIFPSRRANLFVQIARPATNNSLERITSFEDLLLSSRDLKYKIRNIKFYLMLFCVYICICVLITLDKSIFLS